MARCGHSTVVVTIRRMRVYRTEMSKEYIEPPSPCHHGDLLRKAATVHQYYSLQYHPTNTPSYQEVILSKHQPTMSADDIRQLAAANNP